MLIFLQMSVRPENLSLAPPFELEKPNGKPGKLDLVKDPETGLSLGTYSVDRRSAGSNNLVIVYQPWSDYVERPFAQQRMDIMAAALDANLIGVNNLGVGIGTSNIPPKMRKAIMQGDFSAVSELQWRAIQQTELYNEDDSKTAAYYSLATNMAMSAAANAPEGTKLDRMILWDCAAIEPKSYENDRFKGKLIGPRRFGSLALTYFGHGADGWEDYLAENAEYDWIEKPSSIGKLIKRIAVQPGGHFYYPYGMAQKTAAYDMAMAHEKKIFSEGTIVHVINGSESKVSPTALNDRFAEQMADFELPELEIVRTVLMGETHAIQDSFRRTDAVFRHLARTARRG